MQEFTRDWFGRRKEEAFTYSDDRNRFFNWDSGRTNYSSFFTRSTDALSTSAKMIGSMFRVIGVPKSFDYVANRAAVSNEIQIPLHLLKDEETGKFKDPDPELLDAFYGASIQNAALAAMQTSSDYGKTVACRNASKRGFALKDYMFSILNTERIDKKLANRLPGYLKFVQKYKEYAFDKNYIPIEEDAPVQKRLLDLVTRMLRYPAKVTEEELKEFEKPLKQIERILKKNGGIPNTSDECMSMASSLSNIIYKFIPPEEEPPPSDPGKSDDDSDENEEGTPPPSGGDDEPEENDDDSDDSEEEATPARSQSLSKDDLNKLARKMMAHINPGESDSSTEEEEDEFNELFEEFVDDMQEETPMKDWDDDGHSFSGAVKFIKADSEKSRYQACLSSIDSTKAAVLQKLFQRKSKDYQFSMKSMRSGRLDTNKIAEATQRVPTIYERYGQVKTDKICIGVLIDESGSMSGASKIKKAQEAAIFINEVFKNMREVQMFIYGHTADETDHQHGGTLHTAVRVYREPGFNMEPYALGSVRARCNNRDGDAILATARRIRKHTPDAGILFVISDGSPSASGYDGRAAIKDTKDKVTKAENLGFQVIQIAIDSSVPSAQMFNHFVKMTDIKNLPKDLISYVSRKVDKLVKERVTL
jgi:cobalamin biosynthesis protein CobT